ncbi:MAG: hypothetical protein HYR56_35130 [Acidobacteria bacterium]|nr:hypothetical protein [Acidobacteriota bacterium]MBI3427333.1 hypothetical protein [Acidobacteriota bacterium]
MPVNGSFNADLDLLTNVALRVKNTSDADIKSAKLIVGFIDTKSNRIVAQICGAPLKGVPAGAEQTVAVLANNSASFRKTVADLGGTVRVLVRVDLVELANATSWKYGLIHRQDPNDPNHWVPIAANRIGQLTGQFKAQPASFRPGAELFGCGCFHGYQTGSHYCAPCNCDLYDENWNSVNNGIGPAEYGDVPTGCNGHTPAECDPCTKISFISPSC